MTFDEIISLCQALKDGKTIQFMFTGEDIAPWPLQRNVWINYDVKNPPESFPSNFLRQLTLCSKWRIKPDKIEGWINIYPPSKYFDGDYTLSQHLHKTKENAENDAGKNKIATVFISTEI